MALSARSLKQDQEQKYKSYRNLDLNNKLYQQKAIAFVLKSHLKQPTILELGCADGSFLEHVNRLTNAKVTGLDISPEAIKLAQNRGIDAKVQDLKKRLPYDKESFDVVISLEVIEHLYDTDFFLAEIWRVLKPKGLLVLSTPNLASLPNRLKLLVNQYPKYLEYSREGAGHIHLYTSSVLSKQLQTQGFRIITLTSPNITCPFITKRWFPSFLRIIAMKLGDWLPAFGSHLVVLAQKQ